MRHLDKDEGGGGKLDTYRSVMCLVFFTNTGALVPLSNEVKISISFSSGMYREISSSSEKRPRSTHCIAATVVMSFVHDASQKTEFGFNVGASSVNRVLPNALS